MVQTLKIHQPFFLHPVDLRVRKSTGSSGLVCLLWWRWFRLFGTEPAGEGQIDWRMKSQMVDTLTNHNGRIYKNTHWMLMHHRVLLFFIFWWESVIHDSFMGFWQALWLLRRFFYRTYVQTLEETIAEGWSQKKNAEPAIIQIINPPRGL